VRRLAAGAADAEYPVNLLEADQYAEARAELIGIYRGRYLNLWMGTRRWRGLNRQQKEFLMKRLWFDGKVAAFDILNGLKPFLGGLAPADMGENAFLGFAPYAAQEHGSTLQPLCLHRAPDIVYL
jgi:hypothetical protein